VAASNNRDHARNLSYCCLLALHIWWCYSSRTSRSWWITHSTQHYRRSCNNIPSFLQRTTPIARFLCEGWTRHDLHILVTTPFCCDRKSRAACAQSFTPWEQATTEIMPAISLTIAHATHMMVLFFTHIPFLVNHTINATLPERLQQWPIRSDSFFKHDMQDCWFVTLTCWTEFLISHFNINDKF